VIILLDHVNHPCPLPNDDGAIVHAVALAVSSEGVLDFMEELQVRESGWEIADKHACVAIL